MENTPKNSEINIVLTRAFALWASTTKFQIVFSIFYFAILFVLASFAINYFGINEKIAAFAPLMQSDPDGFVAKMKELAMTPEYTNFLVAVIAIKAIVFPLNIGMQNVFAVKESGTEPVFNDLLIGYQGINFLKYLAFGIFWNSVFFIMPSPFAVLWVLICFFVSPLMFFLNQNSFKSIAITFTVLRTKFFLVFVSTIVAILFSYSGVLMFGFGILLTFPFWNAIIYACFRQVFTVKS